MTVQTRGARKAIGFDARQIREEDPEKPWRSFHIDRVDGFRLLTAEEVRRIFPEIDEVGIMNTAAAPLE